jgi:signal peptidase I
MYYNWEQHCARGVNSLFEELPEMQDGQDIDDQQQRDKPIWREIVETALLIIVILVVTRVLIQNFRIEGISMEPNFHDGQYLIINKFAYYLHPPERGDVVVFHFPNNPSRDFIKRIVGLPGEKVKVRDEHLFINGKEIEEPYALHTGNYTWGPQTLAEDQYFVLGDNRNNSSDSNNWGPLSGDAILGKAWISYWPPKHLGLVPHYSYAAVE